MQSPDDSTPFPTALVVIAAVCALGLVYLLYTAPPHPPVASIERNQSEPALSRTDHDQREADTRRGFNLGRQIGAKRAMEGFPKPTLEYLEAILTATVPKESDGFQVGFKAGYIDGWEKRNGDPL